MKTILLSLIALLLTLPMVSVAEAKGWVKLYDDKGFTDRILTVPFGQDMGDFNYVHSDDGKSGFNDKASSAKYKIPAGWEAVLCENNNYAKREFILRGTGENPDFGYFNDKASSIKWRKATD